MPPLELLTLLGSSVLAGVLQLWSKAADTRNRERTLALRALNTRADVIDQARRYDNPGFAWTRRSIAILSVLAVIVLPKIVPLAAPEIPVTVGYTELSGGFWFLQSPRQAVTWQTLQGLVITPLDTHLLSAIVGLYFGGSLTRLR